MKSLAMLLGGGLLILGGCATTAARPPQQPVVQGRRCTEAEMAADPNYRAECLERRRVAAEQAERSRAAMRAFLEGIGQASQVNADQAAAAAAERRRNKSVDCTSVRYGDQVQTRCTETP